MQDKLHSAHQPECDPSLAVLSRSCTAFSVADFPRLVCILRNSSVTANDTRRRGDIQAFDARRSSQHPALVSRPSKRVLDRYCQTKIAITVRK